MVECNGPNDGSDHRFLGLLMVAAPMLILAAVVLLNLVGE